MVWMYHRFFNLSHVEGQPNRVQFLGVGNKAAISTHAQVFE